MLHVAVHPSLALALSRSRACRPLPQNTLKKMGMLNEAHRRTILGNIAALK